MSRKFDLQKYKASIKEAAPEYKKDTYVELNEAFQEVIGLKGIPMGHISIAYGLQDVGKSSCAYHILAQAQKQGILPCLICTEGKINIERLIMFGIDMDNMLYFEVSTLEDVFRRIDGLLTDQNNGKLPTDIFIIVDSIGNTVSEQSLTNNKDGTITYGGSNMKAAKVLKDEMRVYSHKINNTRKIMSPHSTGLLIINHAYNSMPAFPGAISSLIPYGGTGLLYAASLVLKISKGKKLEAIVNSKKVKFGITSKISVMKNHLTDVSNEGEFVIVSDAIIPNEKGAIEDYKIKTRGKWENAEVESEED